LRFDGDIGKDEIEEKEVNQRGINIGKNEEVPKQLPVSNKKKTRHELISKARQVVTSDKTLFTWRLCEFV
jgi:nucleolar complex protein 3